MGGGEGCLAAKSCGSFFPRAEHTTATVFSEPRGALRYATILVHAGPRVGSSPPLPCSAPGYVSLGMKGGPPAQNGPALERTCCPVGMPLRSSRSPSSGRPGALVSPARLHPHPLCCLSFRLLTHMGQSCLTCTTCATPFSCFWPSFVRR